MSTFEEKKAFLLRDGVTQEDLDDLVHDVMADRAARINADGIDVQLTFLFQAGWTPAELEVWVQERGWADK